MHSDSSRDSVKPPTLKIPYAAAQGFRLQKKMARQQLNHELSLAVETRQISSLTAKRIKDNVLNSKNVDSNRPSIQADPTDGEAPGAPEPGLEPDSG